jgi:hypothetical protein
MVVHVNVTVALQTQRTRTEAVSSKQDSTMPTAMIIGVLLVALVVTQ